MIAENGQYTSTDSFKYAARIIHNELQLGFDFHSLRHAHATMLIEAGANVKLKIFLGENTDNTALIHVHSEFQFPFQIPFVLSRSFSLCSLSQGSASSTVIPSIPGAPLLALIRLKALFSLFIP